MVKKWKVLFPSPQGPDERAAYLYLPTAYDASPDTRFPVLYMFDGHNVFFDADATYGKSWGMQEYLDYTDTPLMVAAVECSHQAPYGRLQEYAPYSFVNTDSHRIKSWGHRTMEWLVHSFKPDIDARFRTLPDRANTFTGGSSMGGLMALYAALQYNGVFSRAAALSPSLWTNPAQLKKLLQQSVTQPGTVIYMDYGSREISFHEGMAALFQKTAVQLLQKGVFLTSRIVPCGNHCEASWEKQLPFMIHTLMYQP